MKQDLHNYRQLIWILWILYSKI